MFAMLLTGAVVASFVVLTVLLRIRKGKVERHPQPLDPRAVGDPNQRFEGRMGAEVILRSGGVQPI